MKKATWMKIMSLALTLTMALGLAACSKGGAKDDQKGTDEQGPAKYLVGTEPTFAPFDTTDENGNIIGFDMDLMKAIGKDQGFEVEFKSFGFDALIPALKTKNCDIVAAGMNAEDEDRRKQVDFSDTYYDSGLMVVVNKDNTTVKSLDDLTPDMKVAAQIGTTGADTAQKCKDEGKIKEAVINDGVDVCLLQVQNGDVDALILDKPVAENAAKTNDKIKIVGDVLNAESYGFAVAKGNADLLAKINTGLANIKKDGTFEKIYKQWFPE